MSQPNVPWSSEAEQAVLGALLNDNGAVDQIPDLLDEHFFDASHRAVYVAISGLVMANKPADVITVYERVSALNGELDVTLAYINSLAQGVPGASAIRRYADVVIERSKARALLAAGSEAMAAARDQSIPVDERIERVASGLMAMLESTAKEDAEHIGSIILKHTEVIEKRAEGTATGMKSGLVDLDGPLGGGLQNGDLIVLAARPSMGKTALALTIANHCAGGDAVGLFSMEMTKAQLADRTVSQLGRIDMQDVRNPPKEGPNANEFWARLVEASEAAARLKLYIDDEGALTLSKLRAKARAMKRKHRIKLLIIDYLQLMVGSDQKQSRNYQIEEITRGLKALAKDLNIPIIALSQLKRVDGMPGLNDLRDSGAIEQDADVVMFIHRPIVEDPQLPDDWANYAQLFVAKNRQGPVCLISLAFIGNETRFGSWAGPAPAKPGAKGGGSGKFK